MTEEYTKFDGLLKVLLEEGVISRLLALSRRVCWRVYFMKLSIYFLETHLDIGTELNKEDSTGFYGIGFGLR